MLMRFTCAFVLYVEVCFSPFRHFTDFLRKKQGRSLRDFCREMGYNERRKCSGGYDADR
mgnify:CR=1 FL=1